MYFFSYLEPVCCSMSLEKGMANHFSILALRTPWTVWKKMLIIREMQIKITIRYHLIPIRMTIIKKSTNNKCWRECGKKGMLLHCWLECKLIQPLWKMVWRFLRKLGIKLPYYPGIPLLGIYPEETRIEEDTCIPLFTGALFTITRTWKQPRCPSTDEWIKK